MNDAEERFAERLAEDLEHVLGVGIAIDDLELSVADDGRRSGRRDTPDRRTRRTDRSGRARPAVPLPAARPASRGSPARERVLADDRPRVAISGRGATPATR